MKSSTRILGWIYMNKRQIASKAMLIGGIVEILVAILHFLMPFQFVRDGAIAGLPADYQDFVFHGIVAVGLCATIFGALSIYFSQKLLRGDTTAWVFGLSQGVLWTGRTVTELIFPVKIPMFFLANPTTVILPLVVFEAMLFLTPLVAFYRELKRVNDEI